MIDDLVKKYKIDLDKSWLIGDSECDMLAAANSGVRFIKVGNKPITSVYEVNEFHKIIELIRTEGQIR
jgi:histidinol phosphatase-like enzyme